MSLCTLLNSADFFCSKTFLMKEAVYRFIFCSKVFISQWISIFSGTGISDSIKLHLTLRKVFTL